MNDYYRTAGRHYPTSVYLLDEAERVIPALATGWNLLSDTELSDLYSDIDFMVTGGGAYFDGEDYEHLLVAIEQEQDMRESWSAMLREQGYNGNGR